MTPLLEVRGLRKHYRVAKRGMIERGQSGVVRAVDDVSCDVLVVGAHGSELVNLK